MPRFNGYGKVTATKFLGTLNASSEEAAKDRFERGAYVSVCHQCSREISDPEVEEVFVELVE